MSRTAVVTGVGLEMCSALARKLVQEDCKVGMLARSETILAQLSDEFGPKSLSMPPDITPSAQVRREFQQVREAFGPIDILINHSGNATWAGMFDLKPDQFEEAWQVGPLREFSLLP